MGSIKISIFKTDFKKINYTHFSSQNSLPSSNIKSNAMSNNYPKNVWI